MEEEVSLPSIVLAARPGRLVQLATSWVADYKWGERHYELTIADRSDHYAVLFRGELYHFGLSHHELPERLTPFEYGRYCQHLGYFLFQEYPGALATVRAAIAKMYSLPADVAWTRDPIDLDAPIANATLTLPRSERPFAKTLEELLAHLTLPGRRSLIGTYRQPQERPSS